MRTHTHRLERHGVGVKRLQVGKLVLVGPHLHQAHAMGSARQKWGGTRRPVRPGEYEESSCRARPPHLNQARLGPGLGAEDPEVRLGREAITLRHGAVPADDGQGEAEHHQEVDPAGSVERKEALPKVRGEEGPVRKMI